jgi:S-DNA-T family DNA segregation ATPase FtsK/SpoIIIE
LARVQIVFVNGDDRRELDLRVNNPSATVADLVQALDPAAAARAQAGAQAGHAYAPPALMVGDRVVDPEFELGEAGLHEGVVVSLTEAQSGPWGAPPPPPPVLAGRELAVVNGLDAGRRFPIAPGVMTIGRAAGSEILLHDRTISRRHASLEVAPTGQATIRDLGSHNGTWVDGEPAVEPMPITEGALVEVGSLQVETRPINESDKPFAIDPMRHTNAAGTIPFNRPPRPAPQPPPAEVAPPKPPDVNQSKVPLSLISIIAPLVFAGLMFAVLKSPQFLLFAGLSPVMAIGNFVDSKRRGRKTEKSERARYAKEIGEFRGRLIELSDEERRRRAAAYPDPAEVVRRVTLPSMTLWERRPPHPDFLKLRAGIGDVPWNPPVTDTSYVADKPDELLAALDDAATLRSSPVPVDLQSGGVVGIVGDRAAALAMARSLLCQATALSGPADMPVMVLASYEAAPAWDWTKWLPHTRDASGSGRMLSYDPEQSTGMVEARLKAGRDQRDQRPRLGSERVVGPTLLVVVDDESLTEGRRAPTRNLLRGEGGLVAGIVVASTPDRLPAVCTTVIHMTDADGQADLFLPQQGQRIVDFLATGMPDDVARDCARSLARFEDAELDIVGAGLPASIRLLPLLELEECTPDAVLARWKAGGIDPRPASPIGMSENGAFVVDFVADGPHGLVGGTTGSGKSELLRTMVAGLAASVDPDHLTFVLIDFKGGSAFDECSRLPHTVGMVTDLDEHLAERALRCLEAELKHRERTLRDAGAVDLPDYLRNNRDAEPMPRLLVIIDEFATLKAELPDFIDALVGVAQRGRSLGVHMLLATQRPQGAISDNIKANTNLRIALRVQDKNDSSDVIDVPDAANIPRTAPGRAYVRLGPNEVVAVQSALSTGSRNEAALAHVDVEPFSYGPVPRYTPPAVADAPEAGPEGAKDETDLLVLVDAINAAFAQTGRPEPRRPWPDPLPGDIDLDGLIDASITAAGGQRLGFVPLAMADDPDAQTQYPIGWTPADGNLVACGLGGSGTTTTLSSVALGLARLHSPDDVHIYALDFGAAELGALESLPHVGAVILAGERERQTRLIRFLRSELDRRRELGSTAVRQEPMIVTLIDGWSPFAAEYNDLAGGSVFDAFTRVFADGAELGMYTIVAADRANAMPGSLASIVRQRLVLRLADVHDYATFGIRSSAVPDMVPGRALVGGTGQVIQIARPTDGVAGAAARLATAATPATRRPPRRIETLATEVRFDDIRAATQLQTRPWTLPVGVAESTLGPSSLLVYDGEHVLIAGPARSGKSSTLLTVAAACQASRPDATVIAVAGPRSPLGSGDPLVDEIVHPSAVASELEPLVHNTAGFVLVLVDDAESIEDSNNILAQLSTSDRHDLLFVAAGRNDGIRAGYSHWTRGLRGSKLGVLLRPNIDLDGDILGTQLPRRAPVAMVAGRGYVVNSGEHELAQIALPR